MSDSDSRPLTEAERVLTRRWLNDWREAGTLLDKERWERVRALSDDDAWEETQALLLMWEPQMTGDAGEGLIRQQHVFTRRSTRST